MRNLVAILATLLVSLTPGTRLSSQFCITLGPEARYVNAHSTYHISFDNLWASGGHGESELEFPQRFYRGLFAGTTYDADDRISSSLLSGMVRVLYEF